MKDSLFTENLKQSTGMRVFMYLVILLISSLVGVAFSMLFMLSGDMGLKIGQGVSSVMMFVVPPVVYYCITRKGHPMQELGIRKLSPPWWLILIGVALMFVSIPFTTSLTTWNESMNLGGTFAKLEDYLKMMEEAAGEVSERMLKVDSVGGLLLNLLIIALIPAVGEELTFRGVLQQALTRRMKNPHVAIFLSAAIFSFIHFQFYGFLPRMFLGILMGYMLYITNSLWTSMLMHFANNGTAVFLYYLNNKGVIEDAEHFGETDNVWIVVASVAATVCLIVLSWRKGKPIRADRKPI